MRRQSTAFGPSSENLARLLGMAAEEQAEPASDQLTAALLQTRLAGPLPLDPKGADALHIIFSRLRRDLLPQGGRPLGEVLLDKATDVGTFEALKTYGKRLAGRGECEAERAVGITIYHAAIAGALLFHDRRITSKSYGTLADGFRCLADKPWMTSELARHFSKARRLCLKKMQHTTH